MKINGFQDRPVRPLRHPAVSHIQAVRHDPHVVKEILFPLNVRLSTSLTLLVFLALGMRNRRYWLAGAAWMFGFETLYQASVTGRELLDHGFHPDAWWPPVVVFGTYVLGVAFLIAAARWGARPSLPLVGAALLVWAVWIATGFNVNEHTTTNFDPTAEALNEGAKTLLAAAYIWPLWKASRGLDRPAGGP